MKNPIGIKFVRVIGGRDWMNTVLRSFSIKLSTSNRTRNPYSASKRLIMRYLKSTAFLLLMMSSSASVLSQGAIAQLAEEESSDVVSADETAAPVEQPATQVEEVSPSTIDFSALLNGAQWPEKSSLLDQRSEATGSLVPGARSPQFSSAPEATEASTTTASPTPNPTSKLSLEDVRRTVAAQGLEQPSDVIVQDRTQQTQQIAQSEIAQSEADELPVLEPTTPTAPPANPPGTAAPSSPVPSDPGEANPSDSEVEISPTESQPAPGNRPADSEAELSDIPDILFADPNPLNLPDTPENVDIERNPVVTLEQAIELAYRNSQTLQAAILQEEQAAAAVRQQRAANLPTVSTGASLQSTERATVAGVQNPLTGQIVGGTNSGIDTALSGNLQVGYDLLTGGARAASIRAAELQQQVAALAIETQQEQIRLTTANNYYALQESGENIRIQQSFLQEAERNLRDSRLRQEVGVGTRFDTLRAEVQYANARQQLIQAQGNQRIARRDIARLLNLPPTTGIEATPVAVAENWPLTLEESILLAYQNRAELEQQLLQANISEQQRRIALSAVRPRVSLFANYNAQDQLNSNGGSGSSFFDNYSFGAQFNMLLFDGGAARASARQQEIASQINEEQFSQQSDQIRFDVEQAFFNLETNQENITTSRIAVSQAEEALQLANLRLQAGVGTQLDVLTAQSELTQAQANNVTAILGYNRALAAIQRAVSNVTVE